MPLNSDALVRRRRLLGLTQHDLAVMAGVSPTTLSRIELRKAPDSGGKTGIDVLMRLAEALRMNPQELMIAPAGNRYARAVQFAAHQQSPQSSPKLHDATRSIRAQGYRKLTGLYAQRDVQDVIDRVEPDAIPPEPVKEPEEVDLTYNWVPDPSTE